MNLAKVSDERLQLPPPVALEWLAKQRIYFGHQSVGQNLIDGVKELTERDSTTGLTVVLSDRPDLIKGAALIHSQVGVNGDPPTKGRDFRNVIAHGFGEEGGIVLYKLCFADFSPSTDVQAVFDEYRRTVDDLRARYPALTIAHVTAPLTTVEEPLKHRVKRFLGRQTRRATSAKINAYNALLRSTYREGPLFDLAQWESTQADGSRSAVVEGGDTTYVLRPEWTSDGGHLNAEGRQVIASKLLAFLASLRERTGR